MKNQPKKLKTTPYKPLLLSLVALFFLSCDFATPDKKEQETTPKQDEKKQAHRVLDNWHQAAASADFEAYFDIMAENSVFIGTDATENWNKQEFQEYARPHFEKGKAWHFIVWERNLYSDSLKTIIWFDELLQTQMGVCRGSGTLKKINNQWKIKHYVLSMAIPNEKTTEVVQSKKIWDSVFVSNLQSQSK